eukprot:3987492-Pyramimonas_sp.AAC.1
MDIPGWVLALRQGIEAPPEHLPNFNERITAIVMAPFGSDAIWPRGHGVAAEKLRAVSMDPERHQRPLAVMDRPARMPPKARFAPEI